MRRRLLRRPSPSFALAVVALFVALGGTTMARVIITGSEIKNGSLTGSDIKNHSLTGVKIQNGSLTGSQLKHDSLGGTQIKESSLGKVPSAGNADNANAVGGKGAGSFAPAGRWALITTSATGATILAQSGGLSATRSAQGVTLVGSASSFVGKPLLGTLNSTAGFLDAAPCGGNANNPGGVACAPINDNNHVRVRVYTVAGALTDNRTFYISIGG